MSRPGVSVVMPFGGPAWDLPDAIEALRALDTRPGDELILVDNVGAPEGHELEEGVEPPIRILRARGERSPGHARNVGAGQAARDWILFLDADCRPAEPLLEAYFATPPNDGVGALAGEIVAAGGRGLASRYGAARNFLSQQSHLEHPFLPRAVAANLLVRRAAFEQIGGFYEGVRAAEDTDFTWRLQRAGWRLELCDAARVEHRYRTSVGQLRRQWRSYGAGRAWLSRRYEGFEPEPALVRALSRARHRRRRAGAGPGGSAGSLQRGAFLALDILLGVEELAGLTLSNRPESAPTPPGAAHVLVADRFPSRQDPLVELATAVEDARIEALRRPEPPDLEAMRSLSINYLEDEGAAPRAAAAARLLLSHPLRAGLDVLRRRPGEPSTWALAPAVLRLGRQPAARLQPLGGPEAQRLARRLARLAGRRVDG